MEVQKVPETSKDEISHVEKPKNSNVDATFDVAKEAIGGNAAELGRGYYRSPNFIGSVAVSSKVYSTVTRNFAHFVGFLPLCLLRISRLGSSG